MAGNNAAPNNQCTACQDPHEASVDPRNWVSAQQAIEEIEIEMNRFLSAKYSTQTVSTCDSIHNMRLDYIEVAPIQIETQIDNENTTTSTGSAQLVADFYVPGTFLYTPEGVRSLRREFHLRHNGKSVQIHPDPARTPRAQIQDITAFKRRCPYVRVETKSSPIDMTGWCVQIPGADGGIIRIPIFPTASIRHATCI